MAIFNIIETIFFISLAITFVLIVLLVYHFKQRMVTLEQKQDTVVEIINNIVKELTFLKKSFMEINSSSFIPPLSGFVEKGMSFVNSQPNTQFNKIHVIKEEDEDEDEAVEDENDDEKKNDHEDDDDDIDYKDEAIDDDDEDGEDKDEAIDDEDEDKDDDIDYKDDEEEYKEDDDDIEHGNKDEEDEEDEKKDDDMVIMEDLNINKIENENIQVTNILEDITNSSPIMFDITETTDFKIESVDLFNMKDDIKVNNNIGSYRKMNIHELRSIVVSHGLTTDSSKMKKNELIELLENMTK
jgi:hypothetical protein